jgi:hypothetical protein
MKRSFYVAIPLLPLRKHLATVDAARPTGAATGIKSHGRTLAKVKPALPAVHSERMSA